MQSNELYLLPKPQLSLPDGALARSLLNWRARWFRICWATYGSLSQASKRVMDVVGATLAIAVLGIPSLFIALLIRLDGGSVFFRQERVGYKGKIFTMYKFRSMRPDADALLDKLQAHNEKAQGVTFKMKNDPRVTWVGRYLRKLSIDEFPQFWNVLRGDMSLVGPRPATPREVEKYTLRDRRRLAIKPGLTCLWQVGERQGGLFEVGDRNQIDFQEQVALDVRYIESRTLAKDIWIVLKTFLVIIMGTGM